MSQNSSDDHSKVAAPTSFADTTPANLVVPLSVHALCLGSKDIEKIRWHGPSTDVSRLSARNYRPSHVAHLPDRTAGPSECGVHLHWVLPWAWRRGVVTDGEAGKAVFPVVPDRWLVTRLVEHQPARSWVVESDYCASTGRWGGTWVPSFSHLPSVFLGRSVPVEKWRDRGEQWSLRTRLGKDLTAVGWGDPAFAAYYPNCRNIFGFHDKLEGVPNGAKIKYVVTGWHSRPEDDLIRLTYQQKSREAKSKGANEQAIAADTLRELGLKASSGTVLNQFQQSLCSGITRIDSWNAESNLSTESPKVSVTLGNNLEECLAALVAKGDSQAEKSLNAFQCAPEVFSDPFYLKDEGNKRALRIEEATHTRRFGTIDAGVIWVVRPKGERTAEERREPHPIEADQDLAAALAALNAAQHQYDYAEREVEALQKRIQLGWKQLAELVFGARKSVYIKAVAERVQNRDRLRARLEADIARLDGISLDALRGSVQQASVRLQHCLQRHPENSYTIERIPPPRYWYPLDPVVLIHGVDMTPPSLATASAHQTSSEDPVARREPALTYCRSETEVKADPSTTTKASLGNTALGDSPLLAQIVKLVDEASKNNQTSRQDGNESQPRVRTVEAWRPRFIKWKVSYQAAHGMAVAEPGGKITTYTPATLTHAWKEPMCASLELMVATTVQDGFNLEVADFGLANVKTPRRLFDAIEQRAATDPERFKSIRDVLSTAKGRINPDRMVSTTLEGLHHALLMQQRGIDLHAPVLADLTHFERAADFSHWAPLGLRPQMEGTLFSPLRGGSMKVLSLEMIDVFGCGKVVPLTAPFHIASALKEKASDQTKVPSQALPSTTPPSIHLPPRLCPPARLVFRFKSAVKIWQDSLHHQIHHSPVLGWIVPDYFDQALQLCDETGRPLGLLKPASIGTQPAEWRTVITPEEENALGPDLASLLAACRAENGSELVGKMLQVFDQQLRGVVAEDSARESTLAMLVGRPLAIVRAEIGLDLHGLPPRVQNVAPLTDSGVAEDLGFSNLEIPVCLGDSDRHNDGLVGFFHWPSQSAEQTFSAANFSGPSILKLTAKPGRDRLPLMLFVDPQAPVHATTGLLPEKSIRLLPAQFRYSLERLGLLFSVGPVLESNRAPWPLPLPNVGEHTWMIGEKLAPVPEAVPPTSTPTISDLTPRVLPRTWLCLVHSSQSQPPAKA